MCGIAGILQFERDHRADPAALRAMCQIMAHRGPDDDGYYTDGPAGIGMRRLSIVDLATGHQPISNEDGSLTIVFNGEIYNHVIRREQLAARGHSTGRTAILKRLSICMKSMAGLRPASARHVRFRNLGRSKKTLFIAHAFGSNPLLSTDARAVLLSDQR